MLKDVLSNGALTHFATLGLAAFVILFVGIAVWVLTRSRREIHTWSRIPLTGDQEAPLEPRERSGAAEQGHRHTPIDPPTKP